MKNFYALREKIRFIRILRGYDEEAMASSLGMQQPTYSYLENHRKRFSDEELNTIASTLNVSRSMIENFDPEAALSAFAVSSNSGHELDEHAGPKDDAAGGSGAEIIQQLKAHIHQLTKNIEGLRIQLKEQNDTIRTLRKTNQALRQLLKVQMAKE